MYFYIQSDINVPKNITKKYNTIIGFIATMGDAEATFKEDNLDWEYMLEKVPQSIKDDFLLFINKNSYINRKKFFCNEVYALNTYEDYKNTFTWLQNYPLLLRIIFISELTYRTIEDPIFKSNYLNWTKTYFPATSEQIYLEEMELPDIDDLDI